MRSLVARRRQALILAVEEKLRMAEAQGDGEVAAGLLADLAELHRERIKDTGRGMGYYSVAGRAPGGRG